MWGRFASCFLVLLFLLPSAVLAKPDCEGIYATKLADMNKRLEQEKRQIENEHQKQLQVLQQNKDRLEKIYEAAIKEQISPNAADEKKAQKLRQNVEDLGREIKQKIRSLDKNMTDEQWDPIMAEINRLQAERDAAHQKSKEFQKNLMKSRKPYGERQEATRKAFDALNKADAGIRALESEKKKSLERLEDRRERELHWLKRQLEHCKKTGQWVAQETGPIGEKCRCEVKAALERLALTIAQRRSLEPRIRITGLEMAGYYNDTLEELSKKAAEGTIKGDTVVIGSYFSLVMALGGKALDEEIELGTKTLSEFSATAMVGKAVVTNPDNFYKIYEELIKGKKKKEVEKLTPSLLKFLKSQHARNQLLARRKALIHRENEAWKAVLKAARCLPNCKLQQPKQLIDQLGRQGPGAKHRKAFNKGLHGPNSPYQKGLLATDLHCDLCQALQALLELQAYRNHAHSTLAQLRQAILLNKKALRDITAQLIRYQSRQGVLGDKYYQVVSAVASLYGPVGIGVALGDGFFNILETYQYKLPTQRNLKGNLNLIGRFLDENETDEIYWKYIARATDSQMDELLRRLLGRCLAKPCDKKLSYSPSTLEQSGLARHKLQGRDRATGQVFLSEVEYTTAEVVEVDSQTAMAYVPDDSQAQRMLITEAVQTEAGSELQGYCLDPFADPPASVETSRYTTIRFPRYEPDANPFNQEVALTTEIPRIVRESELPRTGVPKEKEVPTVTQWYLWNLYGNFEPDDSKKIIEEQVKANKVPATPEDIDKLNKGLWDAVDLTKKNVRSEL
jgi:hypothetical protein